MIDFREIFWWALKYKRMSVVPHKITAAQKLLRTSETPRLAGKTLSHSICDIRSLLVLPGHIVSIVLPYCLYTII